LFYPGDWTRDLDDQPLDIEGAWIRICCRLHWSNPYGEATKSLSEWSYILRTHPNKTGVILKTLIEKHIATGEYLDNQNITIISRRMIKDEKIRQIRREVGKLGGNPKLLKPPMVLDKQTFNQKPTPSVSVSVSDTKKEIHCSAEKPQNPIYLEIISYLNQKTNRNFKTTPQNIKLINSRLKEGFIKENFLTVIDNQTEKWLSDEKMRDYLRPITLFSNKFESYLNTPAMTWQEKVKNTT